MLRLALFTTTLISVSFTSAFCYQHRRYSEGNENLVKYHRPKYVYKFVEDSEEFSAPAVDYKYGSKDDEDDEEDDHDEKSYRKPEMKYETTSHHGYHQHAIGESSDSLQDSEHHVEIKHEHGTSHQSFKMHHFKPTKLFIKKDYHQPAVPPKEPVEISVSKHSFEFIHPKPEKPKKVHKIKLQLDHSSHGKESRYELKEYTPKVEYHVSKEMYPKHINYGRHKIETTTRKPFTHFKIDQYQSPKIEFNYTPKKSKFSEYKWEQPKKYQYKTPYKEQRPIVEYETAKDYEQGDEDEYSFSNEYYYRPQTVDVDPHENHKMLYTIYRGNNDSQEKVVTGEESEEEVPHDIHVYH